ncbi:MAG: hypothetical protein HY291_01315 [Planctomycetes bacterium]|nr:hypothetical protein [Planctomycetota bacterium]
MEILYCDTCGKRIKPGEETRKPEGKTFCPACLPKSAAAQSAAVASPSGSLALVRPASSTQHPVAGQTPPTGDVSSEARALNRRSTVAPPRSGRAGAGAAEPLPAGNPPGNKNAVMAVLIGAAVLVVAVVAIVLGNGGTNKSAKSSDKGKGEETSKSAVTPALPKPTPAMPVVTPVEPKIPSPTATVKEDPGASVVDIREGFAKRTLDNLIAKEKSKELTAFSFRKELETFVANYGSTKAGQEGATLLRTLPVVAQPAEAAPPPVSGDSKVLFHCAFETEDETRFWSKGKKVTENAFGGSGSSWQLNPISGGWFSLESGVSLGWSGKDVKIGPNSWIRFAYRFDDRGDNVCLQILDGKGNMYEKHQFSLKKAKWSWATLKLSDFKNLTKDGPNPIPAGTPFMGMAFYGGKDGKECALLIDQFTVGDGPPPPEPQDP